VDTGSFEVEGQCFMRLQFMRDGQTMNFRAIIADGGKEVFGIQTDPGATVTLRATAQ
jgi:hypothetical protein